MNFFDSSKLRANRSRSLLNRIEISESKMDEPQVLPASNINDKEVLLLQELGKASSSYVEDLYTAKSVGPLIVELEE